MINRVQFDQWSTWVDLGMGSAFGVRHPVMSIDVSLQLPSIQAYVLTVRDHITLIEGSRRVLVHLLKIF